MNKTNYDSIRYEGSTYYTTERNTQIVIALLKKNGIRHIVASPGATNFALVGSMQHDSFFNMYSCVDERGAAYMAIGIAEKTGEPVVLSCTGATSSRNYMAALTQAFQRKLPILVITSSLTDIVAGHLRAQMTDRSHAPLDVVASSFLLPIIHKNDSLDEWNCTIKVNQAIAELKRLKVGPVHLNLCTSYSTDFSVKKIPSVKNIPLYLNGDSMPAIPNGRIGIFVGSHRVFTDDEINAIEHFCSSYNGVVFCDHTSGYNGNHRLIMSLPFIQSDYTSICSCVDLLIHIGEISGDYYTLDGLKPKAVWRVNEDGIFVDYFYKLTSVFKMSELQFFNSFPLVSTKDSFVHECRKEYDNVYSKIPELPLSNIWIAHRLHQHIPSDSRIHFAILNSLRAWNFFELAHDVKSRSNVGGFGIDGCVSSLIGAALCNPHNLYFGIFGDLAVFYDINIFMQDKFPNNIRIIVLNNGRGTEFRNYSHTAFKALGKSVDAYVAAAGHFGAGCDSPLRAVCEVAGLVYYPIGCKEEFDNVLSEFLNCKSQTSMLLEVFTNSDDESTALRMIAEILHGPLTLSKITVNMKSYLKKIIRNIKYRKLS